ncbi:MAG: hypothetical protein C4298_01580 [Thermus sp.]
MASLFEGFLVPILNGSNQALGMLLGGPLADRIFEPAFGERGVGTGVLLVLVGILGAGVALLAFLFPQVREVEDQLEDADETPFSEAR